ncbi:acyl dehydratase [Marmoricola sp. URHA0025 HA25]
MRVGPITRTDIVRYAGAGGDFNPVHHDDVYARSLGLPGVFAMGLLGAGYLSRVLAEEFGASTVQRFTVRFRAQVWPGETLDLAVDGSEPTEQRDVRQVRLSARNESGELKITAEALVLVTDSPATRTMKENS